jgi:predicted ATP-dependent endonuclease of OLD family
VELFEPPSRPLPDAATATEIESLEFEFLQGVFELSGLTPIPPPPLFAQNPKTVRKLQNASNRLNTEIQKEWTQGRDLGLTFRLLHHGSDKIELYLSDPAVKEREVSISKRSTGVTNFFRLSMTLRARRAKNKAERYIFLFDEPGTHLHPKGQRNLLQVFEGLASDTQLLYATHSIFLLNHNFPERHRLVFKDSQGTKVELKGDKANWKLAASAMGITLPPSVFFCDRIVLVEGDSDPLYYYELIRQLNRLKKTAMDANYIGFLSFNGKCSELRYLLSRLRPAVSDGLRICLLTDGDDGGKSYIEKFGKEIESARGKCFSLDEHHSVEDYTLCPAALDSAIFRSAELILPGIKEADPKLNQLYMVLKQPEKTLGKKLEAAFKQVFEESVSKPTIARHYVEVCRELKDFAPVESRIDRANKLMQSINGFLEIPKQVATNHLIDTEDKI